MYHVRYKDEEENHILCWQLQERARERAGLHGGAKSHLPENGAVFSMEEIQGTVKNKFYNIDKLG